MYTSSITFQNHSIKGSLKINSYFFARRDELVCHCEFTELQQGSYRSWKTWKVMKFKNFTFQAWKVMEYNIIGRGQSWEIKVWSVD